MSIDEVYKMNEKKVLKEMLQKLTIEEKQMLLNYLDVLTEENQDIQTPAFSSLAVVV